MPPPIFQPGDEVLIRENGTASAASSALCRGPGYPVNRGRPHADAGFRPVPQICPTAPRRRALPLPPVHERLILLSQAVGMVSPESVLSLILVGPPGLGKTHEVTRTSGLWVSRGITTFSTSKATPPPAASMKRFTAITAACSFSMIAIMPLQIRWRWNCSKAHSTPTMCAPSPGLPPPRGPGKFRHGSISRAA